MVPFKVPVKRINQQNVKTVFSLTGVSCFAIMIRNRYFLTGKGINAPGGDIFANVYTDNQSFNSLYPTT
jgi:hypothetical protein